MLKKKILLKIKSIITTTLLASFMLNSIAYAEINSYQMNSVISKINAIDDTVINTGNLDIEEVALSYTLNNDNWIAFYKNFIRELGGIKISYYNESGNLIAKKNVLPKQFEGTSYEFEKETVYVDNTFILRDTVNKYSIDLSSFNFTDNIPCFIKRSENNTSFGNIEDGIKDSFVEVDFNKWENCKSAGILIEPITFYPDSTEEIYCNDKTISKN